MSAPRPNQHPHPLLAGAHGLRHQSRNRMFNNDSTTTTTTTKSSNDNNNTDIGRC